MKSLGSTPAGTATTTRLLAPLVLPVPVPRSVIRLGAQADQGVTVYAENVKLARAQPGSNGPRRAIQVSGTERKFG